MLAVNMYKYSRAKLTKKPTNLTTLKRLNSFLPAGNG